MIVILSGYLPRTGGLELLERHAAAIGLYSRPHAAPTGDFAEPECQVTRGTGCIGQHRRCGGQPDGPPGGV